MRKCCLESMYTPYVYVPDDLTSHRSLSLTSLSLSLSLSLPLPLHAVCAVSMDAEDLLPQHTVHVERESRVSASHGVLHLQARV